jgi:hypothetical protein
MMIPSTLLALLSIIALALVARRSDDLRRMYYAGIAAWARWLPVVATGIFLAVLVTNLMTDEAAGAPSLSLAPFFSTAELVVLFLVGPLFLTRLGNVLATAAVLYFIERLVVGYSGQTPTLAVYLVMAAATIVAVLGDKVPWLAGESTTPLAHRFREVLLIAFTIACLAVVFTGIVKIHAFNRWIAATFGMAMPAAVTLGLLVAIFCGWLSVALGFTRNFTIPLLCLPSLFVLAYITGWPSYLLVVPFVLCLALGLSTAERRNGARRGTLAGGVV